MTVLTALVVGLATVAVAPATPAHAQTEKKGATVSLGVGCGVIRSNVAGRLSLTYDYKWTATKWRITNRTSNARTYECTRGTPNSISKLGVRTRIRFAGVGITGCSVGAGASCTGGRTERLVTLPWYNGTNVSSRSQTLSSATFTALYAHSAENIVDGRFIHGSFDRHYWVSHYCSTTTHETIKCSRRT